MLLEGQGLAGDRYCTGYGSYNLQKPGKRQVTLMHMRAFTRQSIYSFEQSRRNLLIEGDDIELSWLLAKGHSITICDAVLKLVGYCDPCHVPTKLAGESRKDSFRTLFWESGGVIAEVVKTGYIFAGDPVVAPSKGDGDTWEV